MEVERAIGLLKCKFRRLKYLDMLLESEIPDVIVSCCVLHNFILDCEGVDEIDNFEEEVACQRDDRVEGTQKNGTDRHLGEQKRMEIALSL